MVDSSHTVGPDDTKKNMLNKKMNVTYFQKVLNLTKCTESKNIHYSLILQGCMNTCSGKSRFRKIQILLYSSRRSIIVMNNLISKLKCKDSTTTKWRTQAGNFTTNKMATVDFCLPKFSATKTVTWKCHVDESTEIRYNIILGRDILTALGLDLKSPKHVIIGGDGPYEGCLEPIADITDYGFKPSTDKSIMTEESFIIIYVNECFKSEITVSSTCRMHMTGSIPRSHLFLHRISFE